MLSSVKSEFASITAELAKELRAELKSFAQQEISKRTDASSVMRKVPNTADDMDTEDATFATAIACSSTVGLRRIILRLVLGGPSLGACRAVAVPRNCVRHKTPMSALSFSGSPSRSKVVARHCWEFVLQKLPGGLAPIETTSR